MRSVNWTSGISLLALVAFSCVEPYDPPLSNEDLNLLVVDGFLNATEDHAIVSITHSLPVKSTDAPPVESGAQVWIEDDRGMTFALNETQGGVYEGNVPGARTNVRYRLSFRTRGSHEYSSDYVTVLETPPIDSVTFSTNSDGVEFAVSTHDPTNTVKNYRWTFEETYEYNARFYSTFMYTDAGPAPRPYHESLFVCWKTNFSTSIIVASTKHMATSFVSKFPLAFVDKNSQKLSRTYSLLVKQQALTDEVYDYWANLERTTEHLGGLFDPLPSEVQGNLHSMTNPGEKVIGLFNAGTVQEERIFVDRVELPRDMGLYTGDQHCELDSLYLEDMGDFHPPSMEIVDPITMLGVGIIGYTKTTKACADCRLAGGTAEMPDFWE